MLDVSRYLGSYVRQSDSTHKVSFWHIPHGCEYDRAQVVVAYFPNEEAAARFEKAHDMPPEMAMMVLLS